MKLALHDKKGFALLLSIIISSIVLAIGLSLLHITIKQLALGTSTYGSEQAFQAAHAGKECLYYLRNAQSAQFTAGQTVALNCLGQGGASLTASVPVSNVYSYTKTFDWIPQAGNDLCVSVDMYVLNNTAGGTLLSYTIPVRAKTVTCNPGDVCTFGFSRGMNQSCNNITGGASDSIQRELTIEF